MPEFINNCILEIRYHMQTISWCSHGILLTTNLSEVACPDPSGKSRELCDSGNELERSCLPRPIGEIPRAQRFGKQTTNNEQ